jgi:hypothetical protein
VEAEARLLVGIYGSSTESARGNLFSPKIRPISSLTVPSGLSNGGKPMDMTIVMMVAASGFLCGVALMYLVMMRTMKKRAAEGQMT